MPSILCFLNFIDSRRMPWEINSTRAPATLTHAVPVLQICAQSGEGGGHSGAVPTSIVPLDMDDVRDLKILEAAQEKIYVVNTADGQRQ